MTLGSDGATSRAPIEPVASRSNMGVQVRPKSVVFHPPPFTAPMYKTFGCVDTPDTARVRPPRNGPTFRHRISPRNLVSMGWEYAGGTNGRNENNRTADVKSKVCITDR